MNEHFPIYTPATIHAYSLYYFKQNYIADGLIIPDLNK